MTKTGPLSKAEKFYVEEHCDKKNYDQIAKDLGRTKGSVQKYGDKFKNLRLKAGGQMGKNNGSVVMTENASQKGDDFRAKKTPTKIKDCVTKVVSE